MESGHFETLIELQATSAERETKCGQLSQRLVCEGTEIDLDQEPEVGGYLGLQIQTVQAAEHKYEAVRPQRRKKASVLKKSEVFNVAPAEMRQESHALFEHRSDRDGAEKSAAADKRRGHGDSPSGGRERLSSAIVKSSDFTSQSLGRLRPSEPKSSQFDQFERRETPAFEAGACSGLLLIPGDESDNLRTVIVKTSQPSTVLEHAFENSSQLLLAGRSIHDLDINGATLVRVSEDGVTPERANTHFAQ